MKMKFLSICIALFGMSSISYLQDDEVDSYVRSGSTSGITLTELTVHSPMGFSSTMYNTN